MITLQSCQLDAMAELRLAGMVHAHLAEHHADSFLPLGPRQREEIVAEGIARARSYGMSAPASLGAMGAFMLELGPTFDSNPVVQQALSDPAVAPDERLQRFAARIEALLAQRNPGYVRNGAGATR